MLRRALAESMKRVKVMATEETVDRRIVVKLLTTYFERGHSPEVLQLMSRMLGFSGEPCSSQYRSGTIDEVASVYLGAALVRKSLATHRGWQVLALGNKVSCG